VDLWGLPHEPNQDTHESIAPQYSQEKHFRESLKFIGNGQNLEWHISVNMSPMEAPSPIPDPPQHLDTTSKLSEHF
jgi:hypothetical protein